MTSFFPALGFALTLVASGVILAQPLEPSPSDAAVRVNVTINPDDSRTAYEFNTAHHRASATTTERDGKVREKILYELDDAGRFAVGIGLPGVHGREAHLGAVADEEEHERGVQPRLGEQRCMVKQIVKEKR